MLEEHPVCSGGGAKFMRPSCRAAWAKHDLMEPFTSITDTCLHVIKLSVNLSLSDDVLRLACMEVTEDVRLFKPYRFLRLRLQKFVLEHHQQVALRYIFFFFKL
jgi:hypothetical protein